MIAAIPLDLLVAGISSVAFISLEAFGLLDTFKLSIWMKNGAGMICLHPGEASGPR